MPDGIVQLYDKSPIIENISRIAVSNGIGLNGLNEKIIDLEGYYINLIGGIKND